MVEMLCLAVIMLAALPIFGVGFAIFYFYEKDIDNRYSLFAQSLARLKTDACADIHQPAPYVDYERSPYFHESGFWNYYLIVQSCPHTFWHCLTLCNDRRDSEGFGTYSKRGTFEAKTAAVVAAYYSQILKIDPRCMSVLMEPRHKLNSLIGWGFGEQPKICFNLSAAEHESYSVDSCKIPDVKEAGRLRKWAKANPVKVVPIKNLAECRPVTCEACRLTTTEPRTF